MELQVFNCDQGSAEWYLARLGVPTMSEAATISARPGPKGGVPVTRRTYMRKLAGEIVTQTPMERFTNGAMERGHEQEPEARALYAMVADVEPVQVGFLKRGRIGCSPDSLIGDDGMLEIKTKAAHLQIEVLETDEVPAEHIAQLQGQLMVAGRRWVDFVSYCPGLPPFIKRVHRDELYIATLKIACEEFVTELDALVERIRNYQQKKAA